MRRAALLLLAVLAAGLGLAASGWAATTSTETYAQLLAQIDARMVTTAIINRVPHDVKVTLRDGATDRAVFPPHGESALAARLKAHGAKVKYTRRKKPAAHHILRYIAGAIVIVIIGAGGGMFLYTRRRQP
jgi:hypothetical protein